MIVKNLQNAIFTPMDIKFYNNDSDDEEKEEKKTPKESLSAIRKSMYKRQSKDQNPDDSVILEKEYINE